MTYVPSKKQTHNTQLTANALWLSKKMIDEGCSLAQTLQIMEEQCKECSIITPLTCVEQCETWRVKRELRETRKKTSKDDHWPQLLNALKNKRRLAILNLLKRHPLSIENLQKRLKDFGYNHSQETIHQYLESLLNTGLIWVLNGKTHLTLYGRKIIDAINKHNFKGQLPMNSCGNEERIITSIYEGAKTRQDFKQLVKSTSLPRTLNRLLKLHLIQNSSSSDRILYFRTKRPTRLENLSPTQERICKTIPTIGISARNLSKSVGINLRRIYKHLRNLRGKKLVFRREPPHKFELTEKGRRAAEFLIDITQIEEECN